MKLIAKYFFLADILFFVGFLRDIFPWLIYFLWGLAFR